MTSATFPYPQRVTAEQTLNRQECLPVCFLEFVCVTRESLLTSKPTLKALLVLTDASLGFIDTHIKKATSFLLETSSVSAPAKGRGREWSSWGSLGLPWSFQAKGESTSEIPGCSTKAFLLRSCWRKKQHCLPRRCVPSGRKPAIESSCLPSLPHPPSSPAPPQIAACMWDRGAPRALLHASSVGICFYVPSTQTMRSIRDTHKENELSVCIGGVSAFAQLEDVQGQTVFTLRTTHLSIFFFFKFCETVFLFTLFIYNNSGSPLRVYCIF